MPRQAKPKRKRHFTPRYEGDTYAKHRGDLLKENKRLKSELSANLKNIARQRNRIRQQTEADDRAKYHELRMMYLGGDATQNRF